MSNVEQIKEDHENDEVIRKGDLLDQLQVWAVENLKISDKAYTNDDEEAKEWTRAIAVFIEFHLRPFIREGKVEPLKG